MEKTGFFEEAPGVKSSTRLGCFIGLISVLLMAGYMTYFKDDPIKIGVFISTAITAIGGAKYLGTKNETTTPKEQTNDR